LLASQLVFIEKDKKKKKNTSKHVSNFFLYKENKNKNLELLLGFYFPLKCENQKTHNVYSEFLLLFM
jgi:protein-tyrosine phosphatase